MYKIYIVKLWKKIILYVTSILLVKPPQKDIAYDNYVILQIYITTVRKWI